MFLLARFLAFSALLWVEQKHSLKTEVCRKALEASFCHMGRSEKKLFVDSCAKSGSWRVRYAVLLELGSPLFWFCARVTFMKQRAWLRR